MFTKLQVNSQKINRMNVNSCLLVLFVFLLSPFTSVGQEIKTIDGVKTIINSDISTTDSDIKLELVRIHGAVGGDDENLWFFLPVDVLADIEGYIYVLDNGNYEIKKFSFDGEFMYTIGQKGKGPGEFVDPVSMDFDAEGNIVVADRKNNRFEVFSPTGRNLKSFRFGKEQVRRFFMNKNGDFLMCYGFSSEFYSMGYDQPKREKSSPLIIAYDHQAKSKAEIGKLVFYKDYGKSMVVNNGDYCIDKNDNCYITFENLNRIDKYDPEGKIVFRIERQLNFEVSELEDTVYDGDDQDMTITLPKMNLVSKAISVDENGRIWVVTANRQMRDDEKVSLHVRLDDIRKIDPQKHVMGNTDNTETDMFDLEVFNSEGILIARIRLDHFVDAMRIFGDRLFIIDQLRGNQVYEYRIIG